MPLGGPAPCEVPGPPRAGQHRPASAVDGLDGVLALQSHNRVGHQRLPGRFDLPCSKQQVVQATQAAPPRNQSGRPLLGGHLTGWVFRLALLVLLHMEVMFGGPFP